MTFIQSLPRPAFANAIAGQLLQVLRDHALLLAGLALFVAAGQIVPRLFGLEDYIRLSLYRNALPAMLVLYLIAFVLCHLVFVAFVRRPERFVESLVRDYRERFLTTQCLAGGLLSAVFLSVLLSVFTSFKIMIPRINPFSWDVAFAEWDAALHGGVAPWELLQPLLGYPAVTEAINVAYHAWVLLLNVILFWQGFSTANPRLRMQFLLAMLLCWSLVGNLAATLLSSAGPCFYGLVTGEPDPFAPLMAYLREAAESHYIPALKVRDILWENYQTGGIEQARGISAMPSMHVSSTFLFVLLGWNVHRWLGYAMAAFFAVIMIGSVHLAWHYAIDGYVAVAMTWALWLLAGRLLDLDPVFRDKKRQAAAAPA